MSAIRSPVFPVGVSLSMPKFKIEYNFANLKETLKTLDVNKIFTPGDGDFNNLFSKVSLSWSDILSPKPVA